MTTFLEYFDKCDSKLKELQKICEGYDPKYDDAKYNEFGEKQTRCDEKHPAYQKLQQAIDVVYKPKIKKQNHYWDIDKDRLSIGVMHELEAKSYYDNSIDNWYIAAIFGGANGPGKWENYLQQIRKLVLELKKKFKDVWLVDLENDCLDDVYTLRIGLRS